ncbi:diaminopropionate ammonia-lyase [Propionibacterium sp.]|uniref:diaminopropionate ammonia-lyase n=1 Tax=Propionibacterium sp. TaxID=1977903 RepID=UPI0039E804A2
MTAPRLLLNTRVDRTAVPGINSASRHFHQSMPGFEETPLRPASRCATALGVRSVWVKDESTRMGMPAFKILGASWATFRALLDHFGVQPTDTPTLDDLRQVVAGKDVTLVAATDGNHGRAVARMAKILSIPAIILVPAITVASRIEAIEGEGAEVRVVDGGYDEAIAASAALADDTHVVVSDTSWPGYEKTPRWVIEGYSTLLGEVLGEIEEGKMPEPTVVAAQMGVGAFSSAVARGFANRSARLLVGVEPVNGDCVLQSVEAGKPITITETQDSAMAGLNCGTPALIAFDDNRNGFNALVSVDDAGNEVAMKLLHADGVEAGESGSAGLAGLLAHREALGLGEDDDVLIFCTEGPTDPVNFERVVGCKPLPSHISTAM